MLKITFWFLLVFIPIGCYAHIYQYVDKDGSVVFTDELRSGAQKIEVEKDQTLTWRRVEKIPFEQFHPPHKVASFPLEVKIIVPVNDQYIRSNYGILEVKAELSFQMTKEHKLQPLLDAKPYGELQATSSFTLENIVRGLHTIQLLLVDHTGQEMARSNAVRFFMYRNIIQKQNEINTPST